LNIILTSFESKYAVWLLSRYIQHSYQYSKLYYKTNHHTYSRLLVQTSKTLVVLNHHTYSRLLVQTSKTTLVVLKASDFIRTHEDHNFYVINITYALTGKKFHFIFYTSSTSYFFSGKDRNRRIIVCFSLSDSVWQISRTRTVWDESSHVLKIIGPD
jgi:hypothetical protein